MQAQDLDKPKVLQYESILPEDFDGTFKFTNWTDEDFIGVWGGKEYHFPAGTRSPMIIPEHSPIEIQNIRKKFAKDLAEREFYKSKSYGNFINQERNPDGSARLNSIQQAASYSLDNLVPFIQRCLDPLPEGKASVTVAAKEKVEDKLSLNENGEPSTEVIDQKTSLRAKAKAL